MTEISIPDGFIEGSFTPFSNHVGPLYYKRETDAEGTPVGWVGMPFRNIHVGGNNRGHGGVLLTLLDEAMGMNAAICRGDSPVVTLSLQTSFLAATEPGHFLMATGTVTQASKSVAFVEGKAWCGDQLVGTANGVWKYLRKPG
ncbi:MAG: PaaI family thioesterase [Ketobacteraceae bacterium]|nr:PaaI family thioesterase [Ketobacteraceae bacterium]